MIYETQETEKMIKVQKAFIPVVALALALFAVQCKENNATEVEVSEIADLYKEGKAQILDVRTQQEYQGAHIPNSTLITLQDIYAESVEIPFAKDSTIYVICRSGNRSKSATDFLRKKGYTQAVSIKGGIMQWVAEGLPVNQGGAPGK